MLRTADEQTTAAVTSALPAIAMTRQPQAVATRTRHRGEDHHDDGVHNDHDHRQSSVRTGSSTNGSAWAAAAEATRP
jgi:hypothetical protein